MINDARKNTLLVLALEIEAQKYFEDFLPLYTGVGKVNAAYNLTRRLAEWKQVREAMPSLVLNIGSAGSPHFKTGTIVNCTQFVQRDFDVTALGHPPYVTPFEDTPVSLSNGNRYHDYAEGICGTGDNFATSGSTPSWNVIDMEAYALAKICRMENVPFGCLKYITDGADGHAAAAWEDALSDAAKQLHTAVSKVAESHQKI
jgi:adenosylhomocysteine nucleosidase